MILKVAFLHFIELIFLYPTVPSHNLKLTNFELWHCGSLVLGVRKSQIQFCGILLSLKFMQLLLVFTDFRLLAGWPAMGHFPGETLAQPHRTIFDQSALWYI